MESHDLVQQLEDICLQKTNKDKIDFIANKAEQPIVIICGKECRPKRRVLNIGSSYYYNNNTPHFDWDDSNSFLKEFSPNYSQCLLNVYDDNNSNIGWHMDKTAGLIDGKVISISFAANSSDEGNILAYMEFRVGKSGKAFLKIPLKHGTCITFDAIIHSKYDVFHRVSKTLYPRINLTFRNL